MKTLATEGKVSVRPKDVYSTLNLVTQSDKNNINKNMQRMRDKCELLPGEKHGEYKLACRIEDIDSLGNLITHTHDNF
jgi:ubiquitin